METLKEQKENESLEGNVLVIKNDETNEEVEIPLKKVPLKSEREEMKLQRKIKIITFLVCLITLAIGIYMGLMITNFLFPERTGYVNPTEQEIVQILENKWLYKDEYEDLEDQIKEYEKEADEVNEKYIAENSRFEAIVNVIIDLTQRLNTDKTKKEQAEKQYENWQYRIG